MRNTLSALLLLILCLVCIRVGLADQALSGSSDGEATVSEGVVLAGVAPKWAKYYNGLGSNADRARAVAVDAAGNVYVTGESDSAGLGGGYLTVKYSAGGEKQWAAYYKGTGSVNRANAVAVDGAGNVYVTGVITSPGSFQEPTDCVTIKYDSAGNEIWVAVFNRPGGGFPEGKAIALDGSGNVFVTGGCGDFQLGSWADFFTVKFDSSGAQIWAKYYDGPVGGDDYANAMAVDNSGNVYVTGASEGSGFSKDYLTIKYSNGGVQRWAKRFSGAGWGDDEAFAVAVDGSGHVYVTGEAAGPDYNQDCLTIKYSASGAKLWAKYYNGASGGDDRANGLALDGAGNVYVTGVLNGSTGQADFVTVKYNSAGIKQWDSTYDGTSHGADEACAIGLDGAGNVYVTGYSAGTGSSDDYATVKYDADGAQLWAKRYNGPANGADRAAAIAVDASGNAHVAGYSAGSGTSDDYAFIKYDTTGGQVWLKRFSGLENGNDRAYAVAVDGAGNSYVTGSALGPGGSYDYLTVKYSAGGAKLWEAWYNGPGNKDDCAVAIALDGSGNAYVTGYSAGAGTSDDYATVKYSSAGVEVWVMRYNGPGNKDDRAVGVAVDANGNAFVTGYSAGSGTSDDYATIKYSSGGAQLWAKRYNGAGNGKDRAVAIAVNKWGNIFVTGTSGTNLDFVTVKYASNGSQSWLRKLAGDSISYSGPTSIAADGVGNVYVAGSHNTDFVTMKYNKTGSRLWTEYYNGTADGFDFAQAVAVDGTGNVYVTGESLGVDFEAVTVKYNSSGNPLWANRYMGMDRSYPSAVSLDGSGNVYIAGSAYLGELGSDDPESYFLTVKYGAGGTQIWAATRSSGKGWFGGADMALDGAGNVYVTGSGYRPGTREDFLTIKYEQP